MSEAQILDIWERGRGRGAAEQALVPLRSAQPKIEAHALAALPVGERDRRLLLLRQATLGPQLQGSSDCPRCGSRVSFSVGVEEILGAGSTSEINDTAGSFTLETHGYTLTLRSLDTTDLGAAAAASSVEEGRCRLLDRAVIAARHGDQPLAARALPAPVLAAVDDALEARDPLAVVPLAMTCTRCGTHWEPLLDCAAFVWKEIEARAERVMNDVHDLAQLYGWTEEAILRISPARRQFYLDLTPTQRTRSASEDETGARA